MDGAEQSAREYMRRCRGVVESHISDMVEHFDDYFLAAEMVRLMAMKEGKAQPMYKAAEVAFGIALYETAREIVRRNWGSGEPRQN